MHATVRPVRSIRCLSDASGSAIGTPTQAVTVASPSVVQRAFVALHRTAGYVLLWEDNVQRGENVHDPAGQTPRFDVNLAFLDANGAPNGQIPGNRARISDTSRDTYGFACLVDWRAITPVWQSNDEINSDRIGVYALNLTFGGRFQAQADPNTPLIDSGNYARHQLLEHSNAQLDGVAMAWAGADSYLLRSAPDPDPLGGLGKLDLIRVNADGLPDASFGYEGMRRVHYDFGYHRLALHWANQRLIAASGFVTSTKLFLFDLTRNGDPVATFGTNGLREIAETATNEITAQVSHLGVGPTFRVLAVWGKRGAPTHTIRYGVLDEQGRFTVAARNLVTNVAGTARMAGFTSSKVRRRLIRLRPGIAWMGGNMAVFVNRFAVDGRAQAVTPAPAAYVARPPLRLTALVGDSQNATIAPRPQAPAPGGGGTSAPALAQWAQRQYGVAWQYRPSAAAPWEIRFSRLTRAGTFGFPAPVPPAPPLPATSR